VGLNLAAGYGHAARRAGGGGGVMWSFCTQVAGFVRVTANPFVYRHVYLREPAPAAAFFSIFFYCTLPCAAFPSHSNLCTLTTNFHLQKKKIVTPITQLYSPLSILAVFPPPGGRVCSSHLIICIALSSPPIPTAADILTCSILEGQASASASPSSSIALLNSPHYHPPSRTLMW
jgi:hypothetical protein